MQKRIILFVHYGDEWVRGSERCLLDLLQYIDCEKYTPIVWCNAKAMEKEVKALGVTVIRSEFNVLLGWNKPRFSIGSLIKQVKKGIRLIKSYNIDVVHVNSGAPNQWMLIAARITGCALITHLHAPYIFRDRFSLGLYHSPEIVGVSRAVIDAFVSDDMSSGKVNVIHNGIDVDYLKRIEAVNIKEKIGLPKNEFLLATVGSLIYRKGIDLVIAAVSGLRSKGIPVSLIVLGDGPERLTLEQQVGDLHLQDNIFFWGECKCPQALLLGDVNVLVSAAREEAFGLVLLEAGLAKLPVIAPNIGGIPEVVIDGETGLLFDSENINSLMHSIETLYCEPIKTKEMGEAAHRRVCRYFSIRLNAEKFSRLYSSIINNKKNTNTKKKQWFFWPLSIKNVAILWRFSSLKIATLLQRGININGGVDNDQC